MIPITSLVITLTSRHPLDLGANAGASLRGALYEALAVMYDTGASATKHDLESNPVAWLMRLEAETTGGKDVPRPIAIRPPLETQPSCQTRFGISFYGKARQLVPLVVSALQGMQGIGVGRGRQSVTLDDVSWIDPLTRQAQPIQAEIPAPLSAEAYQRFAGLLTSDRVTVRFLTPTRIIRENRLCHTPIFRAWFQRLLERVRLLSELYADAVWIPFHELLTEADEVELVQDETRWQEGWSHNRREGVHRPMGGFTGQASYTGNLTRLMPYILLGQSVQVGKNTIKGSGWYEVNYRWQ